MVGKKYNIEYYNVYAIIALGYRVSSIKRIQFRILAIQRLTEYLIQGYAINQKRIEQLQQTIQLISKKNMSGKLQLQEAIGLPGIIYNYTQCFELYA